MKLKGCRLTEKQQDRLVEFFVGEMTARTAADLVGINKTTGAYFFHRLRAIIAWQLDEAQPYGRIHCIWPGGEGVVRCNWRFPNGSLTLADQGELGITLPAMRYMDPSASYQVTFGRAGHLECSCPDFNYRGNCKHTREVREKIYE